MAKKRFTPINYSASEKAHFLRIERHLKLVEQIYHEAIKELSDVAFRVNFDVNKPFSFNDYPNAKKKALAVFNEMAQKVEATILKGELQEWNAAANRNDQLIDAIFSRSRVERKLLEQYQERNLEALKAFQNRKDNGLGLSSRVWRNTIQFKSEIEMGIDLALGEGKSASELSRDLRSYLHNPDNLFRRVRDKHGVLHLSKRAEAYNPGQGVYRSSYKNAMRLARTEINSAYRESDYHRWQQLDFVVGIEIRLSNNPNHCPTCAELAGKYPKDFKFVGWHPHCRCAAIPILKTDAEFLNDIDKILNDDPIGDESDNAITAMPPNFTNWIEANKDRIANAKSVPFFIKDNYKGGNINKGLRFDVDIEKPNNITAFIPKNLDKYEKELGVKIDRSVFNHLEYDVPMRNRSSDGAYFHPVKKYINLPVTEDRMLSKWKAESVVYHEYGHAIDWAKGLRQRHEVKSLMDKYRTEWAKDNYDVFKTLDQKMWELGYKYSGNGELDKMYQVAAFHDTMKALNVRFGSGHTSEYFKTKGFPEAEFIAHAFENKFIGNPVFKQFAPDLYQEMIELIDLLLGIKRS